MLKIDKTISDKELENYYDIILTKCDCMDIIDGLCMEHFSKSFKEIVKLKPDELIRFVEDIQNGEYGNYQSYINRFLHIKKANNYFADILYKTMPQEARRKIFDMAAIMVCPYCNRNYISMFELKRKNSTVMRSTFELDHYFPKSDYPMLAVSFYNLIPICSACNKIKGQKNVFFYPYKDNEDAEQHNKFFSYNIIGSNYTTEKNQIEVIICNAEEKYQWQNEYLKKIYNEHKDLIQEILIKTHCLGKGYIDSITSQFRYLFPDEIDLYRLIYSNYLLEKDWGKRTLSKFTYDIVMEALSDYGIDVTWFMKKDEV